MDERPAPIPGGRGADPLSAAPQRASAPPAPPPLASPPGTPVPPPRWVRPASAIPSPRSPLSPSRTDSLRGSPSPRFAEPPHSPHSLDTPARSDSMQSRMVVHAPARGASLAAVLDSLQALPAAAAIGARPLLRKLSAAVAPAPAPEIVEEDVKIPGIPSGFKPRERTTQFVPGVVGPKGRARQRTRNAIWVAKSVLSVFLAFGLLSVIGYRVAVMHGQAMAAKGPAFNESADCTYAGPRARLEPPGSAPMVGFSIDFQVDTPDALESRLGRQPAVVGSFIKITASDYEADMLLWKAQLLRQNARRHSPPTAPSLMHVALMPTTELDAINPALYDRIATDLRRINYELGVPVLLRFAHEMNGNWNPYGQKPLQYVRGFRRLAEAVRARTNLTALMWAPNMGTNYPYAPNGNSPVPGSDEFRALDTNRDGVLDLRDDPYTPYWPGDSYVDWLGLSVYWFGPAAGVNDRPIPGHFAALVRGNSKWSLDSGQPQWDFYAMFPGKPFAVPETSASYYPGAPPGPGELAIKRDWWRMALADRPWQGMPRLRFVGWFEERKTEERGRVDYAVTLDPAIRAEFAKELPADLIWGDRLSYTCTGEVSVAA
ncbi:glycoside hydrolase superfamily [Hyaloraphidium curvatum]|nr:glycoside hydrolase superfamily [Hyaloraphidium curvatum]